jgi:hypothetical protein
VRKLKLRELQICVDGSDFSAPKQAKEKAMPVALPDILRSYLAQSDRLLVFCSRGATSSSWVDQELAWFIDAGRGDDVLFLVTEGVDPVAEPQAVFPARAIAAGLHRLPWYDLRSWRSRQAKREAWRKVRGADDEMVRLAAHLLGDSAGGIYPAWRRHRERTRRLMIAAAAALSMCLLGLAGTMFYMRSDRYALRQAISAAPSDVRSTVPRVKALLQLGELDRAVDEALTIKRADERGEALLAAATSARGVRPEERVRAIYDAAIDGPAVAGNTTELLAGSIEAHVSVSRIERIMRALVVNDLALSRLYDAVDGLVKRGHKREALRIVDLDLDYVQQQRHPNDGRTEFEVIDLARKLPVDAHVAILHRIEKQLPPDVLPNEEQPDLRQKLVEEYLATGDVDGALRVAHSRLASLKANLESIASHVARAGNRPRSLTILQELPPSDRQAAIARMDASLKPTSPWPPAVQPAASLIAARNLIRAGQIESARARLRDAWSKNDGYDRVALTLAFAEAGAEDEVRTLIDQLPYGDRDKKRAFEALADAEIDAARMPAAALTLRTSCDTDSVIHGYERAAKTADLHFFIVASEAEDQTEGRARLLAAAIRELCKVGRVPWAWRIGELIDQRDDPSKAEAPREGKPTHAWAMISEALRNRGDFARAAAAARRIPLPGRRGCELARVAAAQTASESAADVAALQHEALAFAPKTVERDGKDNQDLSCICHGLSESGDPDDALSLVPRFGDDNDRLLQLRDIAIELANHGSYHRALGIADELAAATKRAAYDGILTAAAIRRK